MRPWGIALTADGRKLYSANGPSNDVSVVDTESMKVIKKIPAGELPWGVAIGKAPVSRRAGGAARAARAGRGSRASARVPVRAERADRAPAPLGREHRRADRAGGLPRRRDRAAIR